MDSWASHQIGQGDRKSLVERQANLWGHSAKLWEHEWGAYHRNDIFLVYGILIPGVFYSVQVTEYRTAVSFFCLIEIAVTYNILQVLGGQCDDLIHILVC